MTASIGQLTYSNLPAIAAPGMISDLVIPTIKSFIAAEQIFPGRLLELATDGVSCQQVQDTGSGVPSKVLGFSVLLTAREGLGAVGVAANGGAVFNIGDVVPVLQRGALYAEWKGTTQTAYSMPNVYHSSTIATDRGKLTDAGTNAGAGTEVSNTGNQIKLRAALPGTGNIVLVDVNLPGAN